MTQALLSTGDHNAHAKGKWHCPTCVHMHPSVYLLFCMSVCVCVAVQVHVYVCMRVDGTVHVGMGATRRARVDGRLETGRHRYRWERYHHRYYARIAQVPITMPKAPRTVYTRFHATTHI